MRIRVWDCCLFPYIFVYHPSRLPVFSDGRLPLMQSLHWRHNGRDSFSNHQPHDCLLNRLFRRRSKKTSKLHVTGLCVWNSPVPGEFPAQMANNAENVSIWWRHHVSCTFCAWLELHWVCDQIFDKVHAIMGHVTYIMGPIWRHCFPIITIARSHDLLLFIIETVLYWNRALIARIVATNDLKPMSHSQVFVFP